MLREVGNLPRAMQWAELGIESRVCLAPELTLPDSESNTHKQSHTGKGTSCSHPPRFSLPAVLPLSQGPVEVEVCNLCILCAQKNALFYFCPTTSWLCVSWDTSFNLSGLHHLYTYSEGAGLMIHKYSAII